MILYYTAVKCIKLECVRSWCDYYLAYWYFNLNNIKSLKQTEGAGFCNSEVGGKKTTALFTELVERRFCLRVTTSLLAPPLGGFLCVNNTAGRCGKRAMRSRAVLCCAHSGAHGMQTLPRPFVLWFYAPLGENKRMATSWNIYYGFVLHDFWVSYSQLYTEVCSTVVN